MLRVYSPAGAMDASKIPTPNSGKRPIDTATLGSLQAHCDKLLHADEAKLDAEHNAFRSRLPPEASHAFTSITIQRHAPDDSKWRNLHRSLVRERNLLAHRTLLDYDLSDPDACKRLSLDLDAQNARIGEALSDIRGTMRAVREGYAALAEWIDSEDADALFGDAST